MIDLQRRIKKADDLLIKADNIFQSYSSPYKILLAYMRALVCYESILNDLNPSEARDYVLCMTGFTCTRIAQIYQLFYPWFESCPVKSFQIPFRKSFEFAKKGYDILIKVAKPNRLDPLASFAYRQINSILGFIAPLRKESHDPLDHLSWDFAEPIMNYKIELSISYLEYIFACIKKQVIPEDKIKEILHFIDNLLDYIKNSPNHDRDFLYREILKYRISLETLNKFQSKSI
ncbi:MAG: hypothetical protein KQA41_03800 [Candidatus Aenigmarchaeota archaeon]|nr:hypothetical protein [Candidatus Aenigmarchaeota archaeon]